MVLGSSPIALIVIRMTRMYFIHLSPYQEHLRPYPVFYTNDPQYPDRKTIEGSGVHPLDNLVDFTQTNITGLYGLLRQATGGIIHTKIIRKSENTAC
jgi:hypothetical protein